MPNDNVSKTLKAVVKGLLLLVVLYFAGRQVVANWHEFVSYEWDFNPVLLGASVLLHLITFVMFSNVWCMLMAGFGHRVHLRHAFKIAYLMNLARYVPGKIWPVFGMAYLARQINISEEVAVTSWVIAIIFALPSAFLATFVGFVMSPDLLSQELSDVVGRGIYVLATVTLIVSLLLILVPSKLFPVANKILRLMKRPPISFNLKRSIALKVYFGYLLCWCSYGVSFWLLLKSVIPNSDIGIVEASASFILAYQVGYLAFFAPGGIGVRELVLTIIFTPYVGAVSAGIAIVARLWNLAVEIAAALLSLLIRFPATTSDSVSEKERKT